MEEVTHQRKLSTKKKGLNGRFTKQNSNKKNQDNLKGKFTNKTKVTKKAPNSEDELNLAKTFHLLL